MSAGRYVVFRASWNHWKGPVEGFLTPAKTAGDIPTDVAYTSSAEVSGPRMDYEHQWIALAFPSATAAASWVAEMNMQDGGDGGYERVGTVRETRELLDDKSMTDLLRSST